MKVFGIGMQRTGTTSLARALNMLGVRTLQFPTPLFRDLDHPVGREFDGFTDNPIPLLYEELDAKFPRSRFVYTIRDEGEWLESARWLFSDGAKKFDWQHERHRDVIRDMHLRLYGTTTFDEARFLAAYREHDRGVREYFANRPNALLTLDVTRGDGFEKLCPFLGKPIPDEPFPEQNKSEPFWRIRIRRLLERLR